MKRYSFQDSPDTMGIFYPAEDVDALLEQVEKAIDEHLGPRDLGRGISAACCDEQLSAALAAIRQVRGE